MKEDEEYRKREIDKFRNLTGHRHNSMGRKSEKWHFEDMTTTDIIKCINGHSSHTVFSFLYFSSICQGHVIIAVKKKQNPKQNKDERLVKLKPIQEYNTSLSNGELHCVAILSEWVRVKREKMKWEGNEAK